MAFEFKMNSLVYIHHSGQFSAPDSDEKISAPLGNNIYISVSHNIINSLPRIENDTVSCNIDTKYDSCMRNVSLIVCSR